MSHELDPKVGRWYRRLDDEQVFKVVAIDEDDGLVEIRTVDGETEEIDSSEWVELDLEATEQPEDYVDPDAKSDDDEDEDDGPEEAEEDEEKPTRGGGRRSRDWEDDDEDDDDWDDDDDEDDDEDDDYDSDR